MKRKYYSFLLDGEYTLDYLMKYYEQRGVTDSLIKIKHTCIYEDDIKRAFSVWFNLTPMEQSIYEYLGLYKLRNKISSHQIAHFNGYHAQYGTKAKQIVGMAIGRMKKKGIQMHYECLK